MQLQIYKHRKGLSRTKDAVKKGEITIGFLGGSITEGIDKWPEYVTNWFMDQFPKVRIKFENIAIGATGSALAIFRVEKEIIERKCDLVFIEYAVNDLGAHKEQRERTREGLLRKLIKDGKSDLAIVYTFCREMYEDMNQGIVPDTIREFEELAEHYKIGSVWMGLYALLENRKGFIRWEDWLPDGIHPGSAGSYCYAKSVINFLKKELVDSIPENFAYPPKDIPEPKNPMNWEKTHLVEFENMILEGPWTQRRCENTRWIEKMLYTCAPGSKIKFKFEGRGLVLGFDFGKTCGDFRYKIDCDEWINVSMNRPPWCPDRGWFNIYKIGEDFKNRIHDFELEVVHGNKEDCKGTNLGLAFAGVIE